MTNHKFSNKQKVKCIATTGQLKTINITYKPENYSNQEVIVEPIEWNGWSDTPYHGEPAYNMYSIGGGGWHDSIPFQIPESLLQ